MPDGCVYRVRVSVAPAALSEMLPNAQGLQGAGSVPWPVALGQEESADPMERAELLNACNCGFGAVESWKLAAWLSGWHCLRL